MLDRLNKQEVSLLNELLTEIEKSINQDEKTKLEIKKNILNNVDKIVQRHYVIGYNMGLAKTNLEDEWQYDVGDSRG